MGAGKQTQSSARAASTIFTEPSLHPSPPSRGFRRETYTHPRRQSHQGMCGHISGQAQSELMHHMCRKGSLGNGLAIVKSKACFLLGVT